MPNHFTYDWMKAAYPREEEGNSDYVYIRDQQQKLRDAGYYYGPVNGQDSDELREATVAAMAGKKPAPNEWVRRKYPFKKYED